MTWQEEFDKRFEADDFSGLMCSYQEIDEVKSFISNLLIEERKKWEEEKADQEEIERIEE